MMNLPRESAGSLSEEERAYRMKLEALVEACLKRIRKYALPEDAEPTIGTWPPP